MLCGSGGAAETVAAAAAAAVAVYCEDIQAAPSKRRGRCAFSGPIFEAAKVNDAYNYRSQNAAASVAASVAASPAAYGKVRRRMRLRQRRLHPAAGRRIDESKNQNNDPHRHTDTHTKTEGFAAAAAAAAEAVAAVSCEDMFIGPFPHDSSYA
jgi:hypothetical protein